MDKSLVTPYATRAGRAVVPTFGETLGKLRFEAVTDPREVGRLILNTWKNGQVSTTHKVSSRNADYVPAELNCDLLRAVRFPTACARFASDATLVPELLDFLDRYSPISAEHRPIAVAFVLASWCADCFHIAPCLHITGPNWACLPLLRALSLLCRRSLLVGHASLSSLAALPRDFTPTLLFAQNDIKPRVMDTLVASNDRAMVVASGRNPLHLYGAKVFTCEEFPTHSFAMPVCVGPLRKSLLELPNRAADILANRFQSRLLRYRFANYSRLRDIKLEYMDIAPEIGDHAGSWLAVSQNCDSVQHAVTRALAAQTKVVADSGYTDFQCVTIEAALFFCHEPGIEEIFMRQIAEIATVILRGRHDDQKVTAKHVGMILRKLGFEPQRVTHGYKVVLTSPIREQLHRAAIDYQIPAVQDGISRCPYCLPAGSVEKNASESLSS
jgi:hypothetical protein